MDDKTHAAAVHRLKTIAGHINGIVRMLEEDRNCLEVIKQIWAAQTALACTREEILDNYLRNYGVLDDHLRDCIIMALQGNNFNKRDV